MRQRHEVEPTSASTRTLVFCCLLAVLCLSGCTGGERPIELVVPFGPGGGTDTFARQMKLAIEENDLLPQPLTIVNVKGAGATVGSRQAKNARPDGHTLLILHDAILTAQAYGQVNYGPESFEAIAGTGEVGLVIAVREDSPYKNLKDLMEDARRRPDEVTFAMNTGAITHYIGLQLEEKSPGAKFRYVQKGGGSDRLNSLQGRHVDVTGFSIEEFISYRDGGLRGLAFFGPQPHPGAPDVPTASQQGYEISNSNVYYWWFPKGTNPEKVEAMAEVLRRAMETPRMREFMKRTHCQPIFLQGEALKERIKNARLQYTSITPRETDDLPNFPLMASLGTLALAVAVFYRSWRSGMGLLGEESSQDKATGFTPRYGLAACCLAALMVYSLVLTFARSIAEAIGIPPNTIGFLPATFLFVTFVGMALLNWRRKMLPFMLAIALVLSWGLHSLFEGYLGVNLP